MVLGDNYSFIPAPWVLSYWSPEDSEIWAKPQMLGANSFLLPSLSKSPHPAQPGPSYSMGAATPTVTVPLQMKFPKASLFHTTNREVKIHQSFSSESYQQKYLLKRLHFYLICKYYCNRGRVAQLSSHPLHTKTKSNRDGKYESYC